MKTIFNHIHISYSEYEYFKDRNPAEKLEFLFQVYESNSNPGTINLAGFFETVKQYMAETEAESETVDTSQEIFEAGVDRVDVMIDEETIMIESNSLRAMKMVVYRFVESGYILSRDVALEKLFRKDKVTRYLRIFRIIDHSAGICLN